MVITDYSDSKAIGEIWDLQQNSHIKTVNCTFDKTITFLFEIKL